MWSRNFWRETLSNRVKELKTSSDRTCAIQICTDHGPDLAIISVYLPHRTCVIASYDDELAKLSDVVNEAMCNGYDLIVMGDFNCHFGKQWGERGWGSDSILAKKDDTIYKYS